MQKYSREIVTEVLAAVEIVDVAGAVVTLKQAGPGRFKGLCPFHTEKTPSFTVSQDRQTFHCFGCGKGGDALRFVMDSEGLNFIEALRRLADRAGIRLPAFSPQQDKAEYLRTQLLEFGSFAVDHFRKSFEDPSRGSAAQEYLRNRRLKDATIQEFALGFAQNEWSALLDAARAKGYGERVIEACGLFKKKEQGNHYYDFFRNRIMFPIRDLAGKVVAFGGRDLADSPAKYINSPETSVYKKSRTLYGLYEARETLRHAQCAILVEGYFDLLRCFDAGIRNVVASCGTALTSEQAALIRRYVGEVVIMYDGDAAGVKAALKGVSVLTAAGLTVRATALPGNQDPDDYVLAEGSEAFEQQVAQAADFVTFYVRMNRDRAATIEGRTEVAHEVFEILAGIEETIRLEQYLKLLSKELGLNEWTCRSEFNRFRREPASRKGIASLEAQEERPQETQWKRDDLECIAVLAQRPELLEQAKSKLAKLTLDQDPFQNILERLFSGHTISISHDFDSETAERVYAELLSIEGGSIEAQSELVTKRINRLERDALQRTARQTESEIREAERCKDMVRVMELLRQKTYLQQQMEKVGAF